MKQTLDLAVIALIYVFAYAVGVISCISISNLILNSLKHWYYCIGFITVAVMFNVISIPLMEKRQLKRRPEYVQYRKTTSRLLILPHE